MKSKGSRWEISSRNSVTLKISTSWCQLGRAGSKLLVKREQLLKSVVHINLLDSAVKSTVNTHSLRKEWEEVSKALSLLSAKIHGRRPLTYVDNYNVLVGIWSCHSSFLYGRRIGTSRVLFPSFLRQTSDTDHFNCSLKVLTSHYHQKKGSSRKLNLL